MTGRVVHLTENQAFHAILHFGYMPGDANAPLQPQCAGCGRILDSTSGEVWTSVTALGTTGETVMGSTAIIHCRDCDPVVTMRKVVTVPHRERVTNEHWRTVQGDI